MRRGPNLMRQQAIAWSEIVYQLMQGHWRGEPVDFVVSWGDPRAHGALACFLLLRRFAKTNQASDLRSAHEAVMKRSPSTSGPPRHFTERLLIMVHRALWLRYDTSAKTEDDYLKRALDVGQRVFKDRPPQAQDNRAQFMIEHALALRCSFGRTSDASTLSEAIRLYHHVHAFCTLGRKPLISMIRLLADKLFSSCADPGEGIRIAGPLIALEHRMLDFGSPGQQSDALSSLIRWLSRRLDDRLDLEDLDELIVVRRAMLERIGANDDQRAMHCDDLAAVIFRRSSLVPDDKYFIDEHVALRREALQLRPPGHVHRALSCGNLAASLHIRMKQTGDYSLLKEIISLEQEALDAQEEGSQEWANCCGNLASSLLISVRETGNNSLLDRAQQLLETALDVIPPHAHERALHCDNLANVYRARFDETLDSAFLDKALKLQDEALAIRPEDHVERTVSLNEVADTLWVRFASSGDAPLGEKAVALRSEVLSTTPVRHPQHVIAVLALANIHLGRDTAFSDPRRATKLLQKASCLPASFDKRTLMDFAAMLATLDVSSIPQDAVPRLLGVYEEFLSWLALPNFIVDMRTRLRSLRKTHSLGSTALACAIRAGDITVGVELLEHSRAILWLQALNIRDLELEDLPQDKRIEIKSLRNTFSLSEPNPQLAKHLYLTQRDLLHQKAQRLQEVIAEVRTIPGHEYFMRGLPYYRLARVALFGPVVILSAEAHTSHAVIISTPAAAPVYIPLADMTTADLSGMSLDDVETPIDAVRADYLGEAASRQIKVSKRPSSDASANRCLASLWHKVVVPVLRSMNIQKSKGRARTRITWCPTGPFVFVPIHAAGIYDGPAEHQECCSDYIVSSYTPTLTALKKARDGQASRLRRDMTMLTVAESHAPGLPVLVNAVAEVEEVQRISRTASVTLVSSSQPVAGSSATTTVQSLKESLPLAHIVHLACHGIQKEQDPLLSGFCLGDGKLTVADLMRLKLPRAYLAFLSACETAKGDRDQPDQMVHLAAAMLFCGFRSVIGTMWSMGDEDGPEVAKTVYETLFAQEVLEPQAIPYALDAAVQKLREQGVPPMRWATFIHLGA